MVTRQVGAAADGTQGTDSITLAAVGVGAGPSPLAVFDGTEGDDSLVGGMEPDTISGLAGNDTLDGGSAGADTLAGGAGNDSADGRFADDSLIGEAGDDTLLGGSGDDSLDGGADADRLVGGLGNDWMHAGHGDDEVVGGEGGDTLFGGLGDDSVNGGAGRDRLSGDLGADTLVGGFGDDSLDGGEGADRLVGGLGVDTLRGGGASDVLAFVKVEDSPRTTPDAIAGFFAAGVAGGDVIDLSGIDTAATAGDQAFTFLGAAAAFTGAGQVRLVDTGLNTLLLANLDAGLTDAEFAVVILDGDAATAATYIVDDFIL